MFKKYVVEEVIKYLPELERLKQVEQKYIKLKKKLEYEGVYIHECCYDNCDKDIIESEHGSQYYCVCDRCGGVFCPNHEHLQEDLCIKCLVK